MRLKIILKNILKNYGYQVIKPNLRDDHLLRRMKLLNYHNINKVFDVGANIGQYAQIIRNAGYLGNIISFEPLKACFEKLSNNVYKDKNWSAVNYALGNINGNATINISINRESNSILEMLPIHEKHRPTAKYVDHEEIEIHKLDSIIDNFYDFHDIMFLKIDAQGYEYNILEGATQSLHLFQGIQLEMSIEQLYLNEKTMCEIIEYISNKGFKLMSIEPGSVDLETGQMFQVDGIFFKTI